MTIVFASFLFILLPIGLIFLQIFFSKSDNKWVGLIIPFLSFSISLLAVFSIVSFNTSSTTMQEYDENGRVVHETVITESPETNERLLGLTGTIIIVLTLYNIPTVIFLAIYCVCKGKKKRNLAIEKMRIQDLE